MAKIKDKKEAILNATLDLITERGFHATPMSMIAEQAGVSAGTIYRYFKNKEDLINVLFRTLKQAMHEATFTGDSDKLSDKGRFQLGWKNVLHYYIANPKAFKFIEQYYYATFIDEETVKERSELNEPITQFFIDFKETKVLKALPIDALYALAHGPIVSIAKFHLESDLELNAKVTDQIVEAVWEAVAYRKK